MPYAKWYPSDTLPRSSPGMPVRKRSASTDTFWWLWNFIQSPTWLTFDNNLDLRFSPHILCPRMEPHHTRGHLCKRVISLVIFICTLGATPLFQKHPQKAMILNLFFEFFRRVRQMSGKAFMHTVIIGRNRVDPIYQISPSSTSTGIMTMCCQFQNFFQKTLLKVL